MTDILNQIDDAIADTVKDSIERNEQRFDLTAGGRVLDDALGGWFSECCAMRWMPASKAPVPTWPVEPAGSAPVVGTFTPTVRVTDVDGEVMYEGPAWIDETYLFQRALADVDEQTFWQLWRNEQVEALRPESPPCGNTTDMVLGRRLVCENSPGHQGPHRQGMTTWTEAESVPDAALEPAIEGSAPKLQSPPSPLKVTEPSSTPRPWWKRWHR